MKHIRQAFVLSTLLLVSCGNADKEAPNPEKPTEAETKGFHFHEPENNYENLGFKAPAGAQVDVIYQEERDSVQRADGRFFPARGKQDLLAYVPINGSSEHGYFFVGHELRTASPLGDGGGMSWTELKKENGHWKSLNGFQNIDFSSVGGTWHNCGGALTPHRTLLSAEEYPPASNQALFHRGEHFRDTSDFKGLKRYQNMGWMVEIDVETKKPLRKLYQMGRFSHEDVHCMDDDKTVYLTDDYGPGVLFKFVAKQAGDYREGQLYAYKQGEKGQGGDWLPLPMIMDSLFDARRTAVLRSATLFLNLEWIQEHEGKLYIAESGADSSNWNNFILLGGVPAFHHEKNRYAEARYNDPWGRILRLDPKTNDLDVLLEGGKRTDGEYLSNPDGLTAVNLNGKPYLAICEDIGGKTLKKIGKTYPHNELYLLDLSIEHPDVNDLQRFSVGPRGCEQSSPIFTPDGKTIFITLQAPLKSNPPPYDKTVVVGVSLEK